MRQILILLALALGLMGPARAQASDEAAKIRALLADWYERVSAPEALRPWALMAPGGIDAGPGYAEIPARAPGERSAAAYSGPFLNNELAGQALQFGFDVDRLVVNANLARADVWERGYFYAPAAQATYERAAAAVFVLEKQADGQWLILAHQASSQGIPPNRITRMMPDLRERYYARCPSCDPAADARTARDR